MGAIVINGVELPVAISSLRFTPEHVGMKMTRNANGVMVGDRRVVRNKVSFSTVVRPLEETMLYYEIIQARGDYWGLVSDAYSHRGLLITGTGSRSAELWTMSSGQTMILPFPTQLQDDLVGDSSSDSNRSGDNGHTLIGYRKSTGVNDRVFGLSMAGSDTFASTKREVQYSGTAWGSAQTFTGTETMAYSPSAHTFTVTSAVSTTQYGGMLWIPRRFLASQLDELMQGLINTCVSTTTAAPPPYKHPTMPRLRLWSDVWPRYLYHSPDTFLSRNIIAVGEVTDVVIAPAMSSGSFSSTMSYLSATLTEA